jgi:hypothetical protein
MFDFNDFLVLMEKGRPKRRFITQKNENLFNKTGKYATVEQLHIWAAEFDRLNKPLDGDMS